MDLVTLMAGVLFCVVVSQFQSSPKKSSKMLGSQFCVITLLLLFLIGTMVVKF